MKSFSANRLKKALKPEFKKNAVALAIGVKPATLNDYLNGEYAPNSNILWKIANFFNKSLDYFFE